MKTRNSAHRLGRGYYILDANRAVVPVEDLTEWAEWWGKDDRIVGHTQVSNEVRVSTVFIGIDHRFSGMGPPLLFETMVFGGKLDQELWRYSSWDDAEVGHEIAVRKAKAALADAR